MDGLPYWPELAAALDTLMPGAEAIHPIKLNGIDPRAWMTWAIARYVDGPPQSRLDELLPWNYAGTAA
jgi:hypothetical protein